MAERFQIVTKIRDKLYQCDLPSLQKLVKVYKEAAKPDDSVSALKLIEDVIELTAKDERDGVKNLTDMVELLNKLDTSNSKDSVSTVSGWKK